ncbi:hypothetical protein BC629DRAFT_1076986 [Irpex lacteus]|nr:hypothetical protein BC629DRAFT_1076986 [Irpex lacteus]
MHARPYSAVCFRRAFTLRVWWCNTKEVIARTCVVSPIGDSVNEHLPLWEWRRLNLCSARLDHSHATSVRYRAHHGSDTSQECHLLPTPGSTMAIAPLTLRRRNVLPLTAHKEHPITKLPTDIMMYIFMHGMELQRQSTLTCVAFERWSQYFYEESHEAPSEPSSTSFQEAVSQVCRSWRRLTLSMPLLWKYLDFLEGPPYERSLEWIRRSKQVPLDIFIHLRREDLRKKAHKNSTQQINPTCLKLIMDILIPLLPRWSSFVFHADRASHLTNVIEKLSAVDEAPELRTLVLHTSDVYDDVDDTTRRIIATNERLASQSRRLFEGHMPKLRILKLSRAIFSWKLSNLLRPQSNLTCLSISNIDVECSVTLDQFLTMLRASAHCLQTLRLFRFFPEVQSPADNSQAQITPKKKKTVMLPVLTRLSFNFVDPLDIVLLLRQISVPHLESLTLELWSLTGRGSNFEELFTAAGDSVAAKSLEHLCITDIRSTSPAQGNLANAVSDEENTTITSFWGKLANLEVLDVDEVITVDDGFQRAWKMEKTFPRVDTLCVTGEMTIQGLRSLVESTDSARPLKTVVLLGNLDPEMVQRRSKEEGWSGPKVEYI